MQFSPDATGEGPAAATEPVQELKNFFSIEEYVNVHFPHIARFLRRSRRAAQVSDFLYIMGFGTEYAVLKLFRSVRSILGFLAKHAVRLLRLGLEYIGSRLGHIVMDIVGPIEYFARGFSQTWELFGWYLREQGPAGAWRLLKSKAVPGMKHLTGLVQRSLAYLMPLAALAVFCYTVSNVINYDYILAVSVNNKVVGYVQNEAVFDKAKLAVQQRVAIANDRTSNASRKISIEPTYSMAVEGKLLNEQEMADAILKASTDQVQEATALYIDGRLAAITRSGDKLRQLLDDMKAPYEEPDDPDVRVEFTRDVETVDGLYFTDSIEDYTEVANMVTGEEEAEVLYTVQAGDTPWSIAYGNDLDGLDELYALNPQMTESGYNMYVGDQLVIGQQKKFLDVKVIKKVVYDETIPYETVTTESDDYDWGVTKTLTTGSDGLKEVTAEITYEGGLEVGREILNEEILIEVVNEEVVKGTKLKDGSVAATATGTIMWPVPNYKYVSRWMSSYHKGCDICASLGTPILAADSGIVTAAGYSAAGSGYGYSIIINHGNGMTTLYGHCSALYVSAGQYVSQGQVIGAVGSTGQSSGNHCHFEIRIGGVLKSAHDYFPYM